MIILIIRIALTALAVVFLGWLGYVIYLGLNSFFGGGAGLRNRVRAEDESK